MKHRRILFFAAALLAVLFAAAVAYGIYKVNKKINSLSNTVLEIQESASVGSQLSDIPDLSPHKEQAWKVTQFGDVTREQENCYIITSDSGLVIVDGGCNYEVDRLRKIIASYNNQVDAWILSHPHADHINAFLTIWQDPQGIEIQHIYTAQHPDKNLMKENAPWDDYEALETFRSLDIPLEYVQAGDEMTLLDGLKVQILSAYSDYVDEISDDLMNDGAIMFRISGEDDSMLFCTDVGKSMTQYLLDTWGDSLKSDYVQMGHHGYGGPDEEFYRAVDPKAAFFDAPSWLMDTDSDRSTKEKEALMEELGCTVFSFYTAPNQILIE